MPTMLARRRVVDATGREYNNSVRVGSLRHSDTGSGNGRCNSPLFPSTGSWGQALPGSSWQDPQCPQPSISADEEKEDTRKGYHNQEGGRGFGPPLSQDSRLQAIGVLGRNAGFAPASDHFLQEARDQSLLSSAAGSNSNGGRSSHLSSEECFSVKAHAGSRRPAVSCSPASSGNGEKGHEGGNTRHQQENKEGEEEEKEELGPRFDQPRRLQILRALTRDRGAAPTPDSLPQALSIIMRQQGVLRGVSDHNKYLCLTVKALRGDKQALRDKNQQLRSERDSMKRERDAFESTLASLLSSGSAAAKATARAHISPDVENACAVAKSKRDVAQLLIANARRQRAEAQRVVLPPSRDEEGLMARDSEAIGREGTPSTSSMTPPEDTADVPCQKAAAGLGAFSGRAPEEVGTCISRKEQASGGRSDNVRRPIDGSSGRVGLSTRPVSRSSARRLPPTGSSRGVGPSVCAMGQSPARQNNASTAPSARVGTATLPAHHSYARREPDVEVSGGDAPSVRPVDEGCARRQPTIGGASGGGESSARPVHQASRRSVNRVSSQGVGASAQRTARHPVLPNNGLTHSYRRPLSFMDGTKLSNERIRYPIRTASGPRGMAF